MYLAHYFWIALSRNKQKIKEYLRIFECFDSNRRRTKSKRIETKETIE